ncbi:cf4974fb-3452-4ca8-bf80-67d173cbdc92 [Thermothielavioides terrestris]|uniref:Cytochrome P450 monooxygenase ABA1 n=2 Tax=Thermothielavioides terrestris TaxID=2587410 RepID=G2QWY0_THETT|nr:uncharacterized protein THITE_48473 [Thermothielavioides terrestris NRRL 8126]AEO63946.1 hypothetical protein THITE_48473 [Thermothielavioides terrestris NRRL 8126]SPQ23319.1 cf4974fb-3452-4ca8-bf80-67d173cbdc92 [Thermothielavioides terrestris]
MLPEVFAAVRGPYLVPALALAVLACLVSTYVAAWYRLRHFSGPRLASFSYLWMLRICLSGKQAARYEHINDKYGHVARIGPNDLITDDPELVRRMNGARSAYGRSSWYYALRMDPYGEGLFSMIDTAAHDRLKGKLAFGYGGKENPALERDVDEQLARLVGLIRRKYISDNEHTRPLDLAKAAQYFTMDSITKIAYGREFGFLDADGDVFRAIQSAEEGIPFLVILAEMPLLGRIFTNPWVLKLVGPKKTDTGGLGRMLAIAEQVVAERFGPDAQDHRDMLGAFIRHGVSQRQCEIEVPFQIVAGSDTTATAIRSTMLHLASTRHAYTKLQQEIDTAAAEGRISSPVTAEEAKNLEYLQAVIYEGLRIHPPFSGLVMKQAPPHGDTLPDGRFVPPGTRVAHNTLALQRRRDVFGADADVFRPERWLGLGPGADGDGGDDDEEDDDAKAARKTRMLQTTEMVFGWGRWGCAGKAVAFLEMGKALVELLRRFDFEVLHPERPWREENFNMFFQSELWMRVTERFPEAARG